MDRLSCQIDNSYNNNKTMFEFALLKESVIWALCIII